MFDELTHQISKPEGWRTAWLERTYKPLAYYMNAVWYILLAYSIACSLRSIFAGCRALKATKANLSSSSHYNDRANKINCSVYRGYFYISIIYLIHSCIFVIVDAVISAIALKNDYTEEPERWTSQHNTELALYCIGLLAIFVACFFVVPLLQMLLVTYILTRRSNGSSLADYISPARGAASFIAQTFCMALFLLTGQWKPISSTLIRFILVQACWGSALAWLDAAYAFNFCENKILEDDVPIADGSVKNVLRLFARTAKTVHAFNEKDILPRYQDEPEKTPEVDFADIEAQRRST